MAYNVKTNSLTKEGGKTKRILLFNDSCKKGDMVVSVNNVFKLMNDVILGDTYNGIVGKVEEDSENASTKPVLVTLFDDTMTVNVAVEDTGTGEVVEATVQGNILQDIVEETIEDIEEDKSYAYRFLNYDGSVLQEGRMMKGTAPTYTGSIPTKEPTVDTVYTFSGWEPAIGAFEEDTDLTAQFTESVRTYTVTFKNYDDTVLQTSQVAYGTVPTYTGATPTRPNGTFDGWDSELVAVTADTVYTATFIVYSYQSFSAWELSEEIRQQDPDLDVMQINGIKKVYMKGETTLSEEYLACGEYYQMGGDMQSGLVFVKSNANLELVDYVLKTRQDLGDNYYTYQNAFMMPENMNDTVWNAVSGFFSKTIHVVSSQGITTIDLNGSNSITVNESTHVMRYNADYYTETSDTSTEYSTLDSKGWLIAGEYDITDADASVYNSIVDSLKAKGILNASITHDTVNGEITIANGPWSITIQDKNVGATEYLGQTPNNEALAYGEFYYWGARMPDPYGQAKDDRWKWIQSIATVGYHIPTLDEVNNLINFMKVIRPNSYGEDFVNLLLYPYAGVSDSSPGSFSYSWVADLPNEYDYSRFLDIEEFNHSVNASSGISIYKGLSVRLFKDTITFADIDTQIIGYSVASDVTTYLNGIVNSAGLMKNYIVANGIYDDSTNIYRYTSATTGLVYEWDGANLTFDGTTYFQAIILWIDVVGRYSR